MMAPLTLTLIDGLHTDQRQDGHAASVLFMPLRTESNQLSRLLQFTAFLGIRISMMCFHFSLLTCQFPIFSHLFHKIVFCFLLKFSFVLMN